VRFVTGVAVIVALATAAFGVEAYMRAGHQQARITALQSDLARLQQRMTADEHSAASVRRRVRSVAAQAGGARRAVTRLRWALQSVPSEAQVAGVRNEFAAYAGCIPQLQREIAGLGVSWRVNPGKNSINFFKLSTNAPISTSCASALTGR
jgi:predicted phage tail protein